MKRNFSEKEKKQKNKLSKRERKQKKERIIKNMELLKEDDDSTKIVYLCVDKDGISGYSTDAVTKIIQEDKCINILQEFKKE